MVRSLSASGRPATARPAAQPVAQAICKLNAARIGVHVQNLPGEMQSLHQAGLHGVGVHLPHLHAAGGDDGLLHRALAADGHRERLGQLQQRVPLLLGSASCTFCRPRDHRTAPDHHGNQLSGDSRSSSAFRKFMVWHIWKSPDSMTPVQRAAHPAPASGQFPAGAALFSQIPAYGRKPTESVGPLTPKWVNSSSPKSVIDLLAVLVRKPSVLRCSAGSSPCSRDTGNPRCDGSSQRHQRAHASGRDAVPQLPPPAGGRPPVGARQRDSCTPPVARITASGLQHGSIALPRTPRHRAVRRFQRTPRASPRIDTARRSARRSAVPAPR